MVTTEILTVLIYISRYLFADGTDGTTFIDSIIYAAVDISADISIGNL